MKTVTCVFPLQFSMHYCYCCLEVPHLQNQAPLPGSFTESLAWGSEGSLEMPPPPLPVSVGEPSSKSSHTTGKVLHKLNTLYYIDIGVLLACRHYAERH